LDANEQRKSKQMRKWITESSSVGLDLEVVVGLGEGVEVAEIVEHGMLGLVYYIFISMV
jgi:hypothetical protein